MATQTDVPNLSVIAAAVIPAFVLVTNAGTVQNGISAVRTHLGVSQGAVVVGELMTLRMPHAGTSKVTAQVAIAAGALVYYDANGRVGTTSASNTAIGIALQAASGAGSIIEVLFF